MVEAVTVGASQLAAPRGPLFHGFWYLSSLANVFCREFPASVMIPKHWVGVGYTPCTIMVGAATVGTSQLAAPRSPLLHGFWYLSSLENVFCREFPASVMIPKHRVG